MRRSVPETAGDCPLQFCDMMREGCPLSPEQRQEDDGVCYGTLVTGRAIMQVRGPVDSLVPGTFVRVGQDAVVRINTKNLRAERADAVALDEEYTVSAALAWSSCGDESAALIRATNRAPPSRDKLSSPSSPSSRCTARTNSTSCCASPHRCMVARVPAPGPDRNARSCHVVIVAVDHSWLHANLFPVSSYAEMLRFGLLCCSE